MAVMAVLKEAGQAVAEARADVCLSVREHRHPILVVAGACQT